VRRVRPAPSTGHPASETQVAAAIVIVSVVNTGAVPRCIRASMKA
jgi:hypothetical protein